MAWVVAGALGASLVASGARAGDTKLTDELRSGRIEYSDLPYPGSSVHWSRARAVVDAPIDRVMKVIVDYGRYSDFLPTFQASRVLSQRGSNALVYLEAGILKGTVTIWAQLRVQEQAKRGTTRVLEGRMMKGNVERMDARWEVTPLASGKTLVDFRISLDPDLPLPSSMVNGGNRTATRKMIKALRKRVSKI